MRSGTGFDAHAALLDELGAWVFEESPSVRLELLLKAVERDPATQASLAGAVDTVLSELDYTTLLTDTGLPGESGFLDEVWTRLLKKLLPEAPLEHEAAALLSRLFRSPRQARWFLNLAPEVERRLAAALGLPAAATTRRMMQSLRDATLLMSIRIAATGTANEVREGSPRSALGNSPFLRLPVLVRELLDTGSSSASCASNTLHILDTIDACRRESELVLDSLEATGIRLSLVYRLEYIRHSLDRLGVLLPLVRAPQAGAWELAGLLIVGGIRDRDLTEVFRTNGRLIARRIVERAGHTGGHYVTRSSGELHAMVRSAAGGGVLTAAAVAIKLSVAEAHLPPFIEAIAIGANYIGAFVLMQLCNFTLATKQPSMTASALAGAIHLGGNERNLAPLVSQVVRTVRSQVAAFYGNLGAVVPGVLVIDLAWNAAFGSHFLDASHSGHVVDAHHPFASGTLIFAVLTGVSLWMASVAGGFTENWFVVQKLPDAIRQSRTLHQLIGPALAARLSGWLSTNVAGLAGSAALGVTLAVGPMVAALFGIEFEARHVTFVAGVLGFAAMERGAAAVLQPDFLYALAGMAAVGALNFLVSFSLALVVAFRARDVGRWDQVGLFVAVARHFLNHPLDFVRAPASDNAPG